MDLESILWNSKFNSRVIDKGIFDGLVILFMSILTCFMEVQNMFLIIVFDALDRLGHV